MFIATLFVVTKLETNLLWSILCSYKSLSVDNILHLLREGKASIRVICSHDSNF